MSAPLLATKLSVPSTGKHLVDRPYLVTKLDECLTPGCRLALISAPAGYGKTTLLSAWIANLKSSILPPAPLIAWLSLDDRDNDPVRFWSYLIAAIRAQDGGIGKRFQSMLQVSIPPTLDDGVAMLINDLAEMSTPIILVLDDYHLIHSPVIHQSLSLLLEHIPPNFHVLLASRTDPPLPLALLRGRGQIVEIRMDDLRFSLEDSFAYFNIAMGLKLPAKAVESLTHKTEGWIVGLQMAALSLREAALTGDQERIDTFIASFSGSNRYILDYLVEEVINQQPAEIQEFLLRTSILDRLCGPLCDQLFMDPEVQVSPIAQKTLEYLDSSNLFIIPLDDQRYWYRYHQLFSDLLRKRLSQMAPGSIESLHQRAIQWYEQNGQVTKAIDHALQIKDYPKAAALISQVVEEMWGRGEHVTLLNWIKALREEDRRNYPHLWIWQISMLITAGEMQEAERHVRELEAYLRTLPIESDQTYWMGRIYGLRTYIASFYKDLPNLIYFARLALEHLPIQQDAGSRCEISLMVSNAYMTIGDLRSAEKALLDSIETGRRAGRPMMILAAMEMLVIVDYTLGNLKRASRICEQGLQLVSQHSLDHSPMAANLLIGQGLILCEQHRLEEAREKICQGLDFARERNNIWSIAWGYRALLRLLLARNDLYSAETIIHEAEQLGTIHAIPEYHKCGLSGLKAKIWIRQGMLEQAQEYLHSRGIQVDCDIQYPHEIEYWAMASYYQAKGDTAVAGQLLERLLQRAQAGYQQLWIIRCLVQQALLYWAEGKKGQSLQCLARALELAAPEGYIQTFVDEGRPMLNLLQAARRQNGHSEFISILLEALKDEKLEYGDFLGLAAQTNNNPACRALNRRETEIVRLIAEGFSNKEIAQKLYVSVRTVKYYTTNIYTKLDVDGRTQAAVKAKDLGLIS